ncbi:hypothetical protein BU24DRAFT_440534 [Aaosphaeria arxii CBS 175.79]|uniref:Geranylgeranyl pyrophosphate synthetase n=1 Tax=Aaosphaeria arxii CBS 175.79 TaxID=1450172 RepID=A0A6A5XWE0_9PLEO|nr:uncharacterized protein BU24DRAFT_440534 [Aaosphaeria arxii CBS 175.79]KAF2017638.1 hypothetical protein BU24DRAFT_440534 [Aaosphaeria arxii CBS 175.79]
MLSSRGRTSSYGTRGGRWAPRGKGHHYSKPKGPPKPDIGKDPLGQHLVEYKNADLTRPSSITSPDATISNCSYVASYTWMNRENPTILVPGEPPLWKPLNKPRRLEEDKGTYYRDPNAARYPTYPTEPAVQAIFRTNKDFETAAVNIFACGSTLGNLLRFVRNDDKPYRFLVEAVGKTVFFVRKENDPKELIEDVRGFGHTFPEAYTEWPRDVQGSESHQRLVQYTFGQHNCIVRFESDGQLFSVTNHEHVQNPRSGLTPSSSESDEETLIGAFIGASVGNVSSRDGVCLRIREGGSVVPQDSIFDLKTRSNRWGEFNVDNVMPLLYIKQIPNFIIAYHDGAGTFQKDDIHVKSVEKDLQKWETDHRTELNRLSILLEKITEIALKHREPLEIYSSEKGLLQIHKQKEGGTHVLPLEWRKKWAGEGSDSDEGGGSDEGGHYTRCSADGCGYCGKC